VREEPVISSGAVKAALLLLVLGAIGFGVYATAGGVDIHLPDINLPKNSNHVTSLSNTTLSDTTLGETAPPPAPPAKPPAAPVPASPPGLQGAEALSRCITRAGGDTNRILTCLKRY
jgi:hypothetical protein